MKRYVLVVAGGKGLRMGNDLPKQFIPLQGKPLLMHTIEVFHQWDSDAELVVVLPPAHQPYWQMLCREIGCKVPHRIADGGETRFHSVSNGLEQLHPDEEESFVAVHDGVRPFVSPDVITACFSEAERSGAAIPVVPMIDSLREMDTDESHPVDRSRYVAVQTPQVFEYGVLKKAYSQPYNPGFTDDASVVEADGHPVRTVWGNRENVKITTPFDLRMAEVLLAGKNK